MTTKLSQTADNSQQASVERRRSSRAAVTPGELLTVTIHCANKEVPGIVLQYSEHGVCVGAEIYDIAIFATDPVAPNDPVHVQLGEDRFEGIVRHVTPKDGVVSVGIEWTPYTLGIENQPVFAEKSGDRQEPAAPQYDK